MGEVIDRDAELERRLDEVWRDVEIYHHQGQDAKAREAFEWYCRLHNKRRPERVKELEKNKGLL